MKIKGLIDEDFVNYKKPSMFIIMPYCSGKCNIGHDKPICQNYNLIGNDKDIVDISVDNLISRYLANPITKSIVFGGLEPFDSPQDLFDFIYTLRCKDKCNNDVVIYTGYTEEELQNKTIYKQIVDLDNITIKFGRYLPDQESHYDKILGVKLASKNQYAKLFKK